MAMVCQFSGSSVSVGLFISVATFRSFWANRLGGLLVEQAICVAISFPHDLVGTLSCFSFLSSETFGCEFAFIKLGDVRVIKLKPSLLSREFFTLFDI